MDGFGVGVVAAGVAVSCARLLPQFVLFVQRFLHLILQVQVDCVVVLLNGDHHRRSVSIIRLSHCRCVVRGQLLYSHYALCCALASVEEAWEGSRLGSGLGGTSFPVVVVTVHS